MSMQDEGKNAKGRNYDQVTKDGGSAAGTLGAGGTGEVRGIDGNEQSDKAGNTGGGGRTDDLLSAGGGSEQGPGFRPAGEAGGLQTGPGGIGGAGADNAGNRQSVGQNGNIGGAAGSQHKDWGHSPVATGGNAQSAPAQDGDAATRASQRQRQGVMPGEEMGHLHPDQGGAKR